MPRIKDPKKREELMRTFIHDLAKFLAGTLCQVCYQPMEIMDANGTWCKRCHNEFTMGLVDRTKRVTVMDLVRKYRKPYDAYTSSDEDEKKK